MKTPECYIETTRFLLRPLDTSDVSEAYMSWFMDPDVNRFIVAATASPSREDLEFFIAERIHKKDVLFLGLFLRETGEHIGNIKFEPMDQPRGHAIMGILIGAPAWRGKGVAQETIEACSKWLARHYGLRRIYLGVDRRNQRAIHAYEKIGFRETSENALLVSNEANIAMVLLLNQQ